MSSSSAEYDSGEEGTINGDEVNGNNRTPRAGSENGTLESGGRIAELLQEEREAPATPQPLGNGVNLYKVTQHLESLSEDGSVLPSRTGSPIDSLLSIPDDSPSVQVYQVRNLFGILLMLSWLHSFFKWRKQHITFVCVKTVSR